jgi:hypothetical protein
VPRRTLALGLAALVAAGCAAAPPAPGPAAERPAPRDLRVRPVENPSRRMDFPGFSILPPQGVGWRIVPPLGRGPAGGGTAVAFVKPLRDAPPQRPEDSHVIAATVVIDEIGERAFDTPGAYLRFIEDRMERVLRAHFRVLAARYRLEPGPAPLCARYDTLVEDTAVPRFPGEAFLLAARGIRCVHPRWPRYVVDAGYSQRVLRGQPLLAMEPETEPFVKSLVFTPERPVLTRPGEREGS